MHRYKFYFAGVAQGYKSQFKDSKCALTVSIDNPCYEGLKFSGMLQLINKEFHSCAIMVCDTLQRHTYSIYNDVKTPTEFFEAAKSAGDLWLDRNMSSIRGLTIPYEIIRWDYWLTHTAFNSYYERVSNLYAYDCECRAVFDGSIAAFLARFAKNNSIINYDRAQQLCLEYLKEECAAICLWTAKECGYEIYTSKRNPCIKIIYEKLIKPIHPNLLKPIELGFKKHTFKDITLSKCA